MKTKLPLIMRDKPIILNWLSIWNNKPAEKEALATAPYCKKKKKFPPFYEPKLKKIYHTT